MPALTRALGAATVVYSAMIIVKPALLAKPCGLTTPAGQVAAPVRTLVAAIGARDAAIGVAMLWAAPGPAVRAALWARVASDAADAAIFGLMLPEQAARRKAASLAASWGTLCAASALQR